MVSFLLSILNNGFDNMFKGFYGYALAGLIAEIVWVFLRCSMWWSQDRWLNWWGGRWWRLWRLKFLNVPDIWIRRTNDPSSRWNVTGKTHIPCFKRGVTDQKRIRGCSLFLMGFLWHALPTLTLLFGVFHHFQRCFFTILFVDDIAAIELRQGW